jgi:hypothetical protein
MTTTAPAPTPKTRSKFAPKYRLFPEYECASLTVNAANVLYNLDIHTAEQLASLDLARLQRAHRCGPVTRAEIQDAQLHVRRVLLERRVAKVSTTRLDFTEEALGHMREHGASPGQAAALIEMLAVAEAAVEVARLDEREACANVCAEVEREAEGDAEQAAANSAWRCQRRIRERS